MRPITIRSFAPWALILLGGAALAQPQTIDPRSGPQALRRPPRVVRGPVFLEQERVAVEILEGVARTTVKHVYRNPGRSNAEHDFLFPLPADAVVSDFKLTMNGKAVAGEVLDRNKARKIYEGIVRRLRDPGLLELVGTQLIHARIFPVPPAGTAEVQLSFAAPLRAVAGLREYTLPLRRRSLCGKVLKSFALDVRISSRGGLGTIYSPTHKIDIARKGDREARISFEASQVLPQRDFQLLYGSQSGRVGLSTLCYHPPGQDGFFLAFISPSYKAATKIQPKDVVFVVDTSGSMAGEKIIQARKALAFCINRLNPGDRFALVPFSTEARPSTESLAENTGAERKKALALIESLEARGGTNIEEALSTALGLRDASQRPFQVLFLTDGLATIGVTDEKAILASVSRRNAAGTRIFVFGVGNDVNTHLLDTMAQTTRASREYVRPGEDLELKVTSLYDKIASPVLTQVGVEIANLATYDLHPRKLPDLFRGSQLMVVGRYKGGGPRAVTLSGQIEGTRREWVFETDFAQEDTQHEFIADLWAARRVGYLLDQIRLSGKNQELVDEIVRLGKKYGIVTPYTSYLVVEESQRLADARGIPNRRFRGDLPAGNTGGGDRFFGGVGFDDEGDAAAVAHRAREEKAAAEQSRKALERLGREKSGAGAVRDSLVAKKLTTAPAAPSGPSTPGPGWGRRGKKDKYDSFGSPFIKRVGEHTFHLLDSVWVDARFKSKDRPGVKKITFLSDAYFELLAKAPQIARFLALGTRVLFEWKGSFYEVVAK